MSLEAIKKISMAEEDAEKMRFDAQLSAKKILSAAEEDGKAMLKTILKESENEISRIFSAADERSKEASEKASENARLECEALEKSASLRMEKAVSAIVERIVNG